MSVGEVVRTYIDSVSESSSTGGLPAQTLAENENDDRGASAESPTRKFVQSRLSRPELDCPSERPRPAAEKEEGAAEPSLIEHLRSASHRLESLVEDETEEGPLSGADDGDSGLTARAERFAKVVDQKSENVGSGNAREENQETLVETALIRERRRRPRRPTRRLQTMRPTGPHLIWSIRTRSELPPTGAVPIQCGTENARTFSKSLSAGTHRR